MTLRPLLLLTLLAGCTPADQPTLPNTTEDDATLLPNGWHISPAGHLTQLPGDMPMRALLTPNSKYLLVSTGGYNKHTLSLLDASTGEVLHHLTVPRTFIGLAMNSAGDHIYLSAGQTQPKPSAPPGPHVRQFHIADSKLIEDPSLTLPNLDPKTTFITGLATHPDGSLYVADIQHDTLHRV